MELAGKYKKIGALAETPFRSRRDLINRQQWNEAAEIYSTDPAVRNELNTLLSYLELAEPGSQQALSIQEKINALRGQAIDTLS